MRNEAPRVGCCGWSEAKAKYFSDFQAVELQTTFYEPPTLELAHKWRALAPESFHFCIKAWQLITHTPASPTYRKLKSKISRDETDSLGSFRATEQVMLAWERTATIGLTLNARIILFQCPASFLPQRDNLDNLRAFFSRINRYSFELAWEPRGDWPVALVRDLCQDLQLMRCVDPFDVHPAEALAPYWRLHGKGAYSYRYSNEDLDELSRMLQTGESAGNSPQYVFFNNIWMKDDALRFMQRK